jgi:hypothetical protein
MMNRSTTILPGKNISVFNALMKKDSENAAIFNPE